MYFSEGLFVTTSIQKPCANHYREHLLHINYAGQCVGILGFLGEGPHEFYPVYRQQEEGEDKGVEGWYVYFLDGHGAVCCVKV